MRDYSPTLRAHPNVVDMAEWRRIRQQQRAANQTDDDAVRIVLSAPPACFVGWQTEPADTPLEPPRKPYSGFRWFRMSS